jgi:selenocysteine lyase/cysteine desulfurase
MPNSTSFYLLNHNFQMEFNALAQSLQPHYSRFDVKNRLLFTGHSHQAWPDVAREGLVESFDVAASDVDTKWGKAFEKVDRLRSYLKNWYNDPDGQYTHALNTHELLVKWLSGLKWGMFSQIITTNAEFYSVFRQMKSLQGFGVNVSMVDAQEVEGLADRIKQAYNPQSTKCIIVSRVFFQTGRINSELDEIARFANEQNVPLLIDDYHGTNVLPFDLSKPEYQKTYWLIGGYKYLQWGEGNCFLRYPRFDPVIPKITGWFASFSTLDQPREEYEIQFDPNMRYAGATFDPAPAFRAAKVVELFEELELTPEVLKAQYHAQTTYMRDLFKDIFSGKESVITLRNDLPADHFGGFVALQSDRAVELREELLKENVFTDARGDILRFGPAPYTTKEQIDSAFARLRDLL